MWKTLCAYDEEQMGYLNSAIAQGLLIKIEEKNSWIELLLIWLVFVTNSIPTWDFQEKEREKTDKSYKISKLLPFRWADHSCIYLLLSVFVFSEYFNVSQLSLYPITWDW